MSEDLISAEAIADRLKKSTGLLMFASIMRCTDPSVDGTEISGKEIRRMEDGSFFARRKWMEYDEELIGPFVSYESAQEAISSQTRSPEFRMFVSIERAILQKLEAYSWYPMAKNDLSELRRRVGL